MARAEIDGGRDVSIPEQGIEATLYERVDGGPMRTMEHTNQRRTVGWYASQRNGRSQFWESGPELKGFYHAEVLTEVLAYRSQPHTLGIRVGRRKSSYTPDRQDFLGNGRCEIIEIKDEYKPERDPLYEQKLRLARLIYARQGWSYRIICRAEIEQEPLFSAVKRIQSFRRSVITPTDEDIVLTNLARQGVAPLAEIRALWPSPIVGFAKMCALMVKRSISIEVAYGINDNCPVRPVSER